MNYNIITFLREYNLNNSRELHRAYGYSGGCAATYCVNITWQSNRTEASLWKLCRNGRVDVQDGAQWCTAQT
jgi:hypothetical protein